VTTTATTATTADETQIGDAATIGIGADSYPATVTEVERNRRGEVTGITVARDRVLRRGLFSPGGGREMRFTLRKDGRFHVAGFAMGKGSYTLHVGRRSYEMDPHF